MKINATKQSSVVIEKENRDLFKKYEQCPVCNSKEITFELSSHDNHYGVAGDYDHYRCGQCSLLFLNPMPTDLFLSNAYPNDYYAYQEYAIESFIKRFIRSILGLDFYTKDPRFPNEGTMLDVGCGSGDFLMMMRNKGWRTFGVEPSESAVVVGKKNGLDIYHGTLSTANYPEKFFDYVRSNHSLEHMTNPKQNIDVIAKIIKPGGKLFIGVPNTSSVAFKFFKEHWWNLGAPQHPINYNSKSLGRLVTSYGFRIVSTRTNSHFTGTLGSYQIKINNKRGSRKSSGPILDFIPFKIIGGWSSKLFDVFKKGDCLEMIFEKI